MHAGTPRATRLAEHLRTYPFLFSKGAMLARNGTMLLPLLGVTLAFLLAMLALMTWLDRRPGLTYEEHMAVAFVAYVHLAGPIWRYYGATGTLSGPGSHLTTEHAR